MLSYLHAAYGFDPSDPTDAVRDTSGNGIPDWWELTHFGVIGIDPHADPDNDGLTNLEEFQHGTDPNNWDTDGDLLPDGWEVLYGFNPLDGGEGLGLNDDPDNDGLTNLQELIHGTDPTKWDTDGDGFSDGHEVSVGSYPTVKTDYPIQ